MRFSVLGREFETQNAKEAHKMREDYAVLKQQFDSLIGSEVNKAPGAGDWSPAYDLRPRADQPMLASDSGSKIGLFPFPLSALYDMAKTVDALRIPIDVLNREIHRNGFEITPVFRYRCKRCKKDY